MPGASFRLAAQIVAQSGLVDHFAVSRYYNKPCLREQRGYCLPSAAPDFKLRTQARFRHRPPLCREDLAAAMDDVTALDQSPVLGAGTPLAADLKLRVEAVARVAGAHADAVDRDARFPTEAFAAARTERLLGLLVPAELGGDGGTLSDAAEACHALGRACASTGMVFAMHQIMVAILVRHGLGSAWHRSMLRDLGAHQRLIASSTTEGTGGGDLRASACAVQVDGGRMSLAKNATVISYGAEADAVVTTARRAPDAAPSDQVLVALLKKDYRLDPQSGWDTLGMRGTCSAGFALTGAGEPEQVLPVPYQDIHMRSMMPIAHLTWSSVWTGVAAGAVERARAFIRNVRRSGAPLPPGAAHLTRATASLQTLRALVASSLQRFESIAGQPEELDSLAFQTAMNLLKVNASETALATVMSAMQACGLAGYRNDGAFSISRALRDILSAPVMINNDRILANAAGAPLLMEIPATLRD
jgi:acyl-CoA dehydrogenase